MESQIFGKEMANWFVIKDLLVTCADERGSAGRHQKVGHRCWRLLL